MPSSPNPAGSVTGPSDGRAGRLAQRYYRAADNLAAGMRETPQRFIPIARWAAESPEAALGLVRYLLADAIKEAKQEPECPPKVFDLLLRLSETIGLSGPPHIGDVLGLKSIILALVPRRRRRRSIHCHGQIASDRRLLLARSVFDIFNDRYKRDWEYNLWTAAAYAIANYDYDHFVMTGPEVERRVRRLAQWIRERAASPDFDPPPVAATPWVDELKAIWRNRSMIEEAQKRAAGRAMDLKRNEFRPLLPRPSLAPFPAFAKSDHLSVHVRELADLLASGSQETPERLIRVAHWAAGDVYDRLRLIRYLLRFGPLHDADLEHGPDGPRLLQQLSQAIGETGIPDGCAVRDLGPEIRALVPIVPDPIRANPDGWSAPSRQMLLARAVVDDVDHWRPDATHFDCLWLMIVYAMCDYRCGRFFLSGPVAEQRLRWFANWLGAFRVRKHTDALVGIFARA